MKYSGVVNDSPQLLNIVTQHNPLYKNIPSSNQSNPNRTHSLIPTVPKAKYSSILTHIREQKSLNYSLQRPSNVICYPRTKLPCIRSHKTNQRDEKRKKTVKKVHRNVGIVELRKDIDRQKEVLDYLILSAVKEFGVDSKDVHMGTTEQEGTNIFDKFFGENGLEEEEKLINTVALLE